MLSCDSFKHNLKVFLSFTNPHSSLLLSETVCLWCLSSPFVPTQFIQFSGLIIPTPPPRSHYQTTIFFPNNWFYQWELLTCDKDIHVTTALVRCWVEDFTDSKSTDITDSNVLRFAGDEAIRQRYTARQISIVLRKAPNSPCQSYLMLTWKNMKYLALLGSACKFDLHLFFFSSSCFSNKFSVPVLAPTDHEK